MFPSRYDRQDSAGKREEQATSPASEFEDVCMFAPLRLTAEERVILGVIERALQVSEYTDIVDSFGRRSKLDRILQGMEDVLSLIAGLTMSSDARVGEVIGERSLRENVPYFRKAFEIARRFKIMNPDKMRSTYGKMMFMLQDSQTSYVKNETGFSLVAPIQLVRTFLEARGCSDLLKDERLELASRVIPEMKGEAERRRELVREKREAREALLVEYGTLESSRQLQQHQEEEEGEEGGKVEGMTRDEVARIVASIEDARTFVDMSTRPINQMLRNLETYFDPQRPDKHFSLELTGKKKTSSYFSGLYGYSSNYYGSGEKFHHDHDEQYTFVFQSFSLWREVMRNMYKLWYLSDADLTQDRGGYHLSNTGQGLNRVQSCPNVGREMRHILNRVQRKVGPWVGLSVVHLGDRDVPNALVFIDKYTQIPRILSPIATTIAQIDELFETDDHIRYYIEQEWGDKRTLALQILSDYFKHGFDGSGDDGGSCIDGRLTSTWNWCSKLQKKPFYHFFMICGFVGFDGDFRDGI
jgi:hypothetical protein